jgi:hypothetical protein
MLTKDDIQKIRQALKPDFDSIRSDVDNLRNQVKQDTFQTASEASDAILSGVEEMLKERDEKFVTKKELHSLKVSFSPN